MPRVINSPCAASRARVVCTGHTHTGIINNTSFSDPDHAHVRARAIPEEFVAAWRERIFANGLEDPVKVTVEEAVRDFGSAKDFMLWAWYANRIGVNNFLELYFEQKSIMRECRLRNPAAAFHARLKRFYAAMKDRITLGHEADVAETAALTLADDRATERVFAALDWEREEKGRKGLINNAIRRLAKKDRPFARSVLKGRRWVEMGISKQAFYCKLKKFAIRLKRL